MPASPRTFRRRAALAPAALLAVLPLLAALVVSEPATATTRRSPKTPATLVTGRTPPALFDIREGGGSPAVASDVATARVALARDLGPQGVLEIDEVTGTPRVIARLDGFLTTPSTRRPADVALGYVRDHLDAFGLASVDLDALQLVRDYVDILGTHHLTWVQTVDGIPAWDHDLRAHVTADGRLISITGAPLAGLDGVDVAPAVRPTDAVRAAYRAVGARAPDLGATSRRGGPRMRTTFASGDDARLVLFGTGRGTALAWRTTSYVAGDEVDVSIVDASSGDVVWRANLVKSDQAGTGLAWDASPGTAVPNGGGDQDPVAFPVVDGTALRGNNAWVYPDTNDDDRPDRQIPTSSSLDWSYPAQLRTGGADCSPAYPCTWDRNTGFSWRDNVEQNATQVYHYLNVFHDHLQAPPIGFTEAAGNFQTANGSGQGVGGDAVVANVLDGARTAGGGLPDARHRWNANMATLPDGEPPLMQMYLFPSIPSLGTPTANGGDDASVVFHEYTHGLSSRLVTYADGTAALNSAQAGAMGEAWSDFYALDYLVSQGLVDDGAGADVILAPYLSAGRVGFLRYEAIDCDAGVGSPNCQGGYRSGTGGFTYRDFGRISPFGPEVHADGEIWSQTLWDLREALGSSTALELVTRAMELSPPEPSYLDMRNAILEADQVVNAGGDAGEIWQVFAARGMGFFAVATDGSDTHPVQDFSTPPACPANCGAISGRVVDRASGEPVTGVEVALAGHASGLLGDLADDTDGRGRFTIPDVPNHGYVLTLRSNAYDPIAREVDVAGDARVRLHVNRDWASTGAGAELVSATPPDYSAYGCGAGNAFDASLGTGWASDAKTNGESGVRGARTAVVRLPRSVDVTSFGVATGATCGDPESAAVRSFTIKVRRAHGRWRTALEHDGGFTHGVLHTFRLRRTLRNVRLVRMVMLKSNHPAYMDMLELSVRGTR
jgi:hypothetical protein